MQQVHPDAGVGGVPAHAQQINLAYSVLKKASAHESGNFSGKKDASRRRKAGSPSSMNHTGWDAPLNPHAYTEREILHYAQTPDGDILGNFCIARGKYLWCTQEDFPLFLLSIYRCSGQLLDEAGALLHQAENPALRGAAQAELAYLLAQQFMDGTALLSELAKKKSADPSGQPIFYLSAMLETAESPLFLSPGEILHPAGVRKHRLYLKNQEGRGLGYLSFPDDRLYYVVVPLFEQKRVRVRIQAAEAAPKKKGAPAPGSFPLHLWLKLTGETESGLPENLNLQIGQLLLRYRKQM